MFVAGKGDGAEKQYHEAARNGIDAAELENWKNQNWVALTTAVQLITQTVAISAARQLVVKGVSKAEELLLGSSAAKEVPLTAAELEGTSSPRLLEGPAQTNTVPKGAIEEVGVPGTRVTVAETEATPLCPSGGCCFIAGTLVETSEGLKRIEDIHVGDLVRARDDKTGATFVKPVVKLFRRPDQQNLQCET